MMIGALAGRWWEYAPHLPQCGMIARMPHAQRLAALPPPLQYAATNRSLSMAMTGAVVFRCACDGLSAFASGCRAAPRQSSSIEPTLIPTSPSDRCR
jgi:hypothetical protein